MNAEKIQASVEMVQFVGMFQEAFRALAKRRWSEIRPQNHAKTHAWTSIVAAIPHVKFKAWRLFAFATKDGRTTPKKSQPDAWISTNAIRPWVLAENAEQMPYARTSQVDFHASVGSVSPVTPTSTVTTLMNARILISAVVRQDVETSKDRTNANA